jgi:tRNA pseudouridine38-40 synthase
VSKADQTAPALGAVRLVVAYDGSDFCGYQRQLGQRTVQAELEQAAARMTGHPVKMRAASRTDSGVHALGQVVAFDTPKRVLARGWMLGLNVQLPDDVRVQGAEAVVEGYDPRYDSLGKHYRYLLQLGEAKNPLLRLRAWQLGPLRVDAARMADAAQELLGTHDFAAFRSADDTRENTVRTLSSVTVSENFAGDPSLVAIDVHGNAFMKNMMRILTGTLLEAGRGKLTRTELAALLRPGAERADAGVTAPAHGLTLMSVKLGRIALSLGSGPGTDTGASTR